MKKTATIKVDIEVKKEFERMKKIFGRKNNTTFSASSYLEHLLQRVKKDHPHYYK